ncbi:uncharacterized protein [Apostichopus japonicus]|uniref:uncharacterized protein n=1 Tax=Stichopus japonicus TaxID=307972 RepID=UPI003AB34238
MDLRLFVLLVITVATWSQVLGQPAFDTSSCAAGTALSGVGTVVPPNTPRPYIVAASPSNYSPGDEPQVFLVTQVGSSQITSIFLQARRVDNGAAVGSFTINNNAGFEFLACGDSGMATVITSGRNPITLPFITTWISPSVSYGAVELVATVVDTAFNIHENLISVNPITANVPLVPLTITPCPAQPTITNQQVTYPTPTCQRGNTLIGDAVCNLPSGSTNFVVGSNTVNCECADAGDTASCSFTFELTAGNPCNPNPCQNGGSCNFLGGGAFFCSCINSFTGTTCEQGGSGLTAQPCPPVTNNFGNSYFWNPPNCLRNGNVVGVATCTPQPGGSFFGANNPVSCVCVNGGQQDICSFNINASPTQGPCMLNPCVGGAECRDAGATEAGYTCHSTVGVPCQ